eukprot:scaffold834_cov244-Pinguiococcus_pyrenoidosus.AAC.3
MRSWHEASTRATASLSSSLLLSRASRIAASARAASPAAAVTLARMLLRSSSCATRSRSLRVQPLLQRVQGRAEWGQGLYRGRALRLDLGRDVRLHLDDRVLELRRRQVQLIRPLLRFVELSLQLLASLGMVLHATFDVVDANGDLGLHRCRFLLERQDGIRLQSAKLTSHDVQLLLEGRISLLLLLQLRLDEAEHFAASLIEGIVQHAGLALAICDLAGELFVMLGALELNLLSQGVEGSLTLLELRIQRRAEIGVLVAGSLEPPIQRLEILFMHVEKLLPALLKGFLDGGGPADATLLLAHQLVLQLGHLVAHGGQAVLDGRLQLLQLLPLLRGRLADLRAGSGLLGAHLTAQVLHFSEGSVAELRRGGGQLGADLRGEHLRLVADAVRGAESLGDLFGQGNDLAVDAGGVLVPLGVLAIHRSEGLAKAEAAVGLPLQGGLHFRELALHAAQLPGHVMHAEACALPLLHLVLEGTEAGQVPLQADQPLLDLAMVLTLPLLGAANRRHGPTADLPVALDLLAKVGEALLQLLPRLLLEAKLADDAIKARRDLICHSRRDGLLGQQASGVLGLWRAPLAKGHGCQTRPLHGGGRRHGLGRDALVGVPVPSCVAKTYVCVKQVVVLLLLPTPLATAAESAF